MNERDLWWKIGIIGALVALGFASIWPPDQKLKFGIDLYGGYSLLYEIDDSGLTSADKQGLSERVMRVLRERVDPKGVFNLVWRPVGHNRLEIQMPRPSEDVVKARRDYERLQEDIQATILHRTDVLRALARTGADRSTDFDAMIHSIDARRGALEAAATVYDDLQKTQAEYDARVVKIQADNLSRQDVLAAVQRPASERSAAFQSLFRGIPARQDLLQAVAKAWDDLTAAQATTRPADSAAQPSPESLRAYEEKQLAFDDAVQKTLDANVDPDKDAGGVTIDAVVALEEKLEAAIGDVLATNVDIGRLQFALDAKPGDPTRQDQLQKLASNFPSLASAIRGMADATDQLHKQRTRGEGRLEDPADLQRLLKGAGVLEFRILPQRDEGNPEKFAAHIETLKTRGPRRLPGEQEFEWFEIEDPADFLKIKDVERSFDSIKDGLNIIVERFGDKFYVLSQIGDNYSLTHRIGEADWSLKGARFDRDEIGRPAIGFSLDERGGDKFATLTRLNRLKQLCIFLDDQAISHATINSVIRTRGIIQGSFSVQEVQDMVKKLNAGSLPKKLKDPPISVRAIGPSLGKANRDAGLRSAKYGAALVVFFMLGYYFYVGGVAIVAVAMNLLFTLAIMALLGATLTLPGIAGLVLSLGMAVDANVLINERMREELARGNAMRMAIKLGYERAFRAILDSNVTTLLTCLILYWVGSEEIKGFGLTLGIGVVLNLFTAYFVTRIFFEVMSLFSIPPEVARYPILLALGVAAFGAGLFGLGYVWNEPAARDHSVLMLFGRALMEIAPAVIGLLLLLWLARAIHRAFQRGPTPRMPMMGLIGVPNINWVRLKPAFFAFSLLITAIGVLLFFNLDKEDIYDIEFLGGTAAQIDLKDPGALDQAQISERLDRSGQTLERFALAIRGAAVTNTGGGLFVITTNGVPAARLEPVIKSIMDTEDNRLLNEFDAIRYADPAAQKVTVRTRLEADLNLERMTGFLASFSEKFHRAGEAIAKAQVQAVEDVAASGQHGRSFEIVTLESNKEIVVGAIVENLQDDLDIQPALAFQLSTNQAEGGIPYFPIRDEDIRQLNLPIDQEEAAQLDLRGWKGAVAMILNDINPPQPLAVLKDRLRAMRLQPGFESHGWRESQVFGLKSAAPGSDRYSRVMVLVSDENYPLLDEQGDDSSAWTTELAEPEVGLLQAALQRQTSLSQVTQFDQSVSTEAQTTAIIAIVLSWLVIIVYLWFRFGNLRWGLSAVLALVHDVLVAVGALSVCHFLYDTAIGKALLLDNFRLDLALVASLLTVVGYSVNDTIVVFDRIRENRGRMSEITPDTINLSVNQTLARTLLTGLTTLFTIVAMYVFGGPGIHGFNFALLIGILTGTYSSFAIAAQFLVKRGRKVAAVAA